MLKKLKLEIERKFLLKSMPDINPSEIIKIEQYYLKNSEGVWERMRSCESNLYGMSYVYTVKYNIGKGINEEDEYLTTEEEFIEFRNKCIKSFESKYIQKERWIYPHIEDNLIWEVDIFKSGHHLIVAEIEIPVKKYKLILPKFIKDKLLIEVTGLKQFSNKNLSNEINIKDKNKILK
jgi:CYTH domain-containing protein